jgi:hypothetical protein
VTLIDALLIINYLNGARPAGEGPIPASAFTLPLLSSGLPQDAKGYIDVVIDSASDANVISVLDALRVINRLNSPAGEGEMGGEGETSGQSVDDFFADFGGGLLANSAGQSQTVPSDLNALINTLAADAADQAAAKRRRSL